MTLRVADLAAISAVGADGAKNVELPPNGGAESLQINTFCIYTDCERRVLRKMSEGLNVKLARSFRTFVTDNLLTSTPLGILSGQRLNKVVATALIK